MKQFVKGTVETSKRVVEKTKKKWRDAPEGEKLRRNMLMAVSGTLVFCGVQIMIMLGNEHAEAKQKILRHVQSSSAVVRNSPKKEHAKPAEVQQPKWHLDIDASKLVGEDGVPVPKNVTLTVEAGTNQDENLTVLHILKEKDLHVVWFVSGEVLDIAKGQYFVKQAAKQGDVIGSLGYRPSQMQFAYQTTSLSTIQTDLEEANKRFIATLGDFPVYYRNPSGVQNADVQAWMKSVGIRSVGWSIDSGDWKTKDTEAIVQQTISSLHDGGTIELHVLPHTTTVLPVLIDRIRAAGYVISVPNS